MHQVGKVLAGTMAGAFAGCFCGFFIVTVGDDKLDWNYAGVIAIVAATFLSCIAGFVAAVSRVGSDKPRHIDCAIGLVIGGAIGLVPSLLMIRASNASTPGAPEYLAAWFVSAVVTATAVAGLVGALASRDRPQCKSPRRQL